VTGNAEKGGLEVGKITSHRDLIVWQKAMDMAVQVYKMTATFPSH